MTSDDQREPLEDHGQPGRAPHGDPSGSDDGDAAPFVVELPNGQRLEIGGVAPGTIVEIATWRGPGSPDARTERMVIAVTPPAEHTESDRREPSSRRRLRWALALGSAFALVVGLFIATPVAATVPAGGDDVLGGRADTAIVVTRPAGALTQGLAVLVRHPERNAVVLGRVSSVSGDSVLVRSGDGFLQVSAVDIVGDVVAAVPFLGAPISWLRQDNGSDRPDEGR